MKCIVLVLMVLASAVGQLAHAQSQDFLSGLAEGHPRLILRDKDFSEVRAAIAKDARLRKDFASYKAEGSALLRSEPLVYTIGGQEHTLLAVSRGMEGRILLLAGLYQLTGDRKFSGRATKEMLAAAAFPDWNPAHFLDTAEMTTALGIGYDWLYDVLSPSERTTIHDALVAKGITPWLERLHSTKFHGYTNNWSQVCYGGETIGALALADHGHPEDIARAREVLRYAQPAMQKIMRLFAPDGGFEEGPVYWNYATIYNVLYIAALQSSLGTDFGDAEASGFSQTGNYRVQSIGPLHQYANFGDAEPNAFPAPQMLWFANRFHNQAYAAQEHALDDALAHHIDGVSLSESSRFSILSLFWDALLPQEKSDAAMPLSASFTRIAQAYMRTGWGDPNAWFIAFKGGDSHASHGHLDLGSFIFDASGERWAMDLGKDDYGLPGYFKQQRWSYYRLSTAGHNTLTVDGKNEDLDAKAPLLATGSNANSMFAIADLSQAYKTKLQSWKRGIRLFHDHRLLVQDDVVPAQSADIMWSFHTAATISISRDGRMAMLRQNGKVLQAHILAPLTGRFGTASTKVPPPQASNKGISNLVIDLPGQTHAESIVVLFTEKGDVSQPDITPLSSWKSNTAP